MGQCYGVETRMTPKPGMDDALAESLRSLARRLESAEPPWNASIDWKRDDGTMDGALRLYLCDVRESPDTGSLSAEFHGSYGWSLVLRQMWDAAAESGALADGSFISVSEDDWWWEDELVGGTTVHDEGRYDEEDCHAI